jgi:hypothetical protein
MKKIMNYLTGFHSIPVIEDLSNPIKVNTINPEFLNIPKDDKFVKEISETRKSLDGLLTSTDIIKDTFKSLN